MAVTLMELLSSYSQLGVYSRIRQPNDRMQRFFGMQVGGRSHNQQRGRQFTYNTFDHTRNVAPFRSPDTGPGTVTPQVTGRVSGTFCRTHLKQVFGYEQLGNMRSIDRNSDIDVGGQNYLTKQQKFLYQHFANARELVTVGVLRGYLGLTISGENLVPVLTGGDIQVNFNVPSTNLNQLKYPDDTTTIIQVPWSNPSAPIVDDLVAIEQTSEARTGRPIAHVWTDSTVWNYVINNTQVRTLAGTAASPYDIWDRIEEPGPDGKPVRYFTASIKAYPHIRWHLYNAGLNVNGTYTRFYDGTTAGFFPEPENDWIEMGSGSEMVVETPGAAAVEREGFWPWAKTTDEPAAVQIMAVDNFCPFLYVPKCVMHATVVGF